MFRSLKVIEPICTVYPPDKMEDPKLKVGSPVLVVGKNIEGTVAFIGTTQFSPGILIFFY